MVSNLVIVESPAKAKTIERFLGKGFKVVSSFGHIRDLEKKDFGVDVENNYAPHYQVSPEKQKVVNELKKLAGEATMVWLASDEDREGEAIAWHLYEVLGLRPGNTQRIVFNEITQKAIENAVRSPRSINRDLVDAQQARRVLDRLVGFRISPVLWRKVKPSLSAGRVQSVAVRLLVEREREVIGFQPRSSYKVVALFPASHKSGRTATLKAELPKNLEAKEQAMDFLRRCANASFKVAEVVKKPGTRKPAPPFTTSTLQQEASRKLGFSVSKTMSVAQRLYEAGKITYMRTDSMNLSELALDAAETQIVSQFGKPYHERRVYKTSSKGAQEAHEAIRPTYFENATTDGPTDEVRLYELIWKRTVASQMSQARLERTTVTIDISTVPDKLLAKGEVVIFDGFLKVYQESSDDEDDEQTQGLLPPVAVGQVLALEKMTATQGFTKAPPRYTEASLVKKLEELGIGRPSTYAPTISTIQNRGYVVKESRDGEQRAFVELTLAQAQVREAIRHEIAGQEKSKLFPTDIGIVVTDFLVGHFQQILSYDFTAKVEKECDDIAQGRLVWQKMIDNFYRPFDQLVEKTIRDSDRQDGERVLGLDPETGKQVSVRIGRFGPIVQLGSSEEGDQKPEYKSIPKGMHLETISLEQALELLRNKGEGRLLGHDPHSGKPVYARVGRYGPLVQMGESDDPEKRYGKLEKGMVLDKLDLAQALSLLVFPRVLGTHEGQTVIADKGRFGPYVKLGDYSASLTRTDDPLTVTLARAVQLVKAKQEKETKKTIKTFEENAQIKVVFDRWGKPSVQKGIKSVRLPEDKDPASLSYQDCLDLLGIKPEDEAAPAKGGAKAGTKAGAKAGTKAKAGTATKAKPAARKSTPKSK